MNEHELERLLEEYPPQYFRDQVTAMMARPSRYKSSSEKYEVAAKTARQRGEKALLKNPSDDSRGRRS
jgi:hypothetical protein